MATPVYVSFDGSVPQSAKQMAQDAMNYTTFPMGSGNLNVAVVMVDEPPVPGHADYMATVTSGASTIYMRRGIEDPDHPMNAGVKGDFKRFFMESFIHELGHAFTFTHVATDDAKKALIGSWFVKTLPVGAGPRSGTLADWNPTDAPWGDRIQEALAEFFKDVFMPEQYRHFDNRANWDFKNPEFGTFVSHVEAVTCQAEGDLS